MWRVIWKFGPTPCSWRHFPGLCEASSYTYVCGVAPACKRKTRWVGSWPLSIIGILSIISLRYAWHSFLFSWSTSSCKALVSSLWERWLFSRDWLPPVQTVCTLPSQSLLCLRLTKGFWRWDLMDSLVVDLSLPRLNVALTITQVFFAQTAPIVWTWLELLAQ